MFGDHKPWLGDNESVYQSLGMPVACDTPEGFLCHYSTQYLIWGNDAAKRALGRELRGDGPTIGPSMLMCTLFDALGWEGPPFMQEQRGLMEAGVTMYHAVAKNVLMDGELYDCRNCRPRFVFWCRIIFVMHIMSGSTSHIRISFQEPFTGSFFVSILGSL